MNRSYDISNIIKIVNEIRELNSEIKVYTEFVYWFPTETFEEFKDYFRIIKYFDYTTFMMYSEKKELNLSKIQKNSPSEIYKK